MPSIITVSATETFRAVSEVRTTPHYLVKTATVLPWKNYSYNFLAASGNYKTSFLFVPTEPIPTTNNIPLKIVTANSPAIYHKTPDGIELVFAFDANTNIEPHKGSVTIQMFAASVLGDEFAVCNVQTDAFAKVALFIIQLEANYTIDERAGNYCVDRV